MRTCLVGFVIASATTPVFADAPGLEAKEVRAQLRSVTTELERCYVERTTEIRGAGHMDLVFDISRYGIVEHLRVMTPGLPARLGKEIDACVRTVVESVAFPVKKTFTTATVPYYLQRTVRSERRATAELLEPRRLPLEVLGAATLDRFARPTITAAALRCCSRTKRRHHDHLGARVPKSTSGPPQRSHAGWIGRENDGVGHSPALSSASLVSRAHVRSAQTLSRPRARTR
jgi:hypothetical protein